MKLIKRKGNINDIKISKRTMEVLSKVMNKFLFDFAEFKIVNEIKSYVSKITQIPTSYIRVKLIKENEIFKINLGYCVSEFEYMEFIIG